MTTEPRFSSLEKLVAHYDFMREPGVDPQAVAERPLVTMLAAARGNDEFWASLQRWVTETRSDLDLTRLRSALPDRDAAPTLTDAQLLSRLEVDQRVASAVLEALAAQAHMEQEVRRAFERGSPAETAAALEGIVQTQQSHVGRLRSLLGGTILAAILIVVVLAMMASGQAVSTLYKGVSPGRSA